MSCHRCLDLCVTFPARTPGELRKAVSIVSANLLDDTLVEILPNAQGPIGAFQSIAEGTEWPDTFDFTFACKSCGERFTLQADTYHGSGGYWKPIRPEASREEL